VTHRGRADPPLGGTFAYIDSLIPALVPSEQRVAREIVRSPQDVAMMSAADLAARTQTSAATVIRTCQSMGFNGFQHLRLLLLRDLPAGPAPMARAGEGASREWLPGLFRTAGDELAHAIGPLDFDAFDRAVAAIAGAHRVLIAGNGASGPMAQLLSIGLMTSGRPNESPVDSVVQQLNARALAAGDVCVCISSSGTNSATLRVAEAAASAGATVIAATGYSRTRLEETSAITLVCGTLAVNWATGTISGNLAQLVLLTALQASVSSALGNPGTDRAVMDEVISVLEGLAEPDSE
jgi:DNA-binding MurR/RpiR family transcriptional regulator